MPPAPVTREKTTAPPWLLHGLLVASGALALIYEVLWLRRFTTVFGATTPATAATLAAFFLGLTAGSAFIGARCSRWRRPLRAYGLLEAYAGFAALLVEPLLAVYDKFYPALHTGLSASPVAFTALKLLLTALALFLPSFCMGGTVPLLAQALAGERARLGLIGSGLYAANTVGAAAGALSVPFFWLPQFGAAASYGICVGLNLVIGALAWALDRRNPPASDLAHNREREKMDTAQRRPSQAVGTAESLSRRTLLAFAALSGALTFILQVAWTRLFAQVHENSIYSFAVVVAVFIVGLAGGAGVARAALRRGLEAKRLLGLSWLAAGATVFVSAHLFFALTDGLSYLSQQGGWMSYSLRLIWLALATMLVPALLSGMALPLLMEMAGRSGDKSAGHTLGRLLAWNTVGVVAGSLLGAFALPKWPGLWGTIAGVGVVMMVVSEVGIARPWRQMLRPLAIGVAIIAGLLFWNPTKLPRTKVRESRGETLVAVQEGSHGIVAVVDQRGQRRLKLDNFYVLGGTGSTGDERMQAHLPLLLHPAPKRVAFLGLGTGITAGGALLHPIERITAIEIVPEVVAAAGSYLAEANLGIVDSPQAEIVVDDARSFLRGSRRHLDVIVGDLVVPWRRGEAALYSAEHFASVRRALAPDGLFCQWLPMFQLSEEDFRIVTATFLDDFPRATLWRGDFAPGQPALALIGHTGAARLDPSAIARRVREMKPDPTNPHLAHEAGLWMFLVGPLDAAQFAGTRRNRENHPWLEILSPLARASDSGGSRAIFVGRPLESFLDQVRARPLDAALPLSCLQWRDAGRRIAEASLLFAERNNVAGERLMQQAAQGLPAEIRGTFLPPTAVQPGK